MLIRLDRAGTWVAWLILIAGTQAASRAQTVDASSGIPPTPPGYPESGQREDPYTTTPPGGTYEQRRAAYIALNLGSPGNGPFSEAIRVANGQLPDEKRLLPGLDKINARLDCSDFVLHGVLRLLFEAGDTPLLSEAYRGRARETILGFKYWPDEPGIDSMCTWTENHYILFASGGYLAGQLYRDALFSNSGQTGREKMAVCRPRILRWLELRYRGGFSEWLSNVYFNEDLLALLNLIDFCEDDEIVQRATLVTDLLLLDIGLNSFQGAFASAHGRTYEAEKKSGYRDHTGAAAKLLFGLNAYSVGQKSATCLALSRNYRLPRVIHNIAVDQDRPEMLNRQRLGLRPENASKWGLSPRCKEDGMLFFSYEMYFHPKVINLTMDLFDDYRWWQNDFFISAQAKRGLIEKARTFHVLPWVVRYYRKDLQRYLPGEANICTYRTPDYMLSSAQDYRKGYGGNQQHVWQATLGPEAVCFTTHPARLAGEEPNYWTGSGSLPRVAQVKNVAIILYRISTKRGLYLTHELRFTHAWLPRDRFDEVIERDGWVFARKGDGYLALWSREPYAWQSEGGEDKDREMMAQGTENIWICELGRRAVDGEFAAFVERISAARLSAKGLRVTYASPSQGQLEFSWGGSLRQDGHTVALSGYPRYGNPYAQVPFPAEGVDVALGGHWLRHDWGAAKRETNAYVDSPER